MDRQGCKSHYQKYIFFPAFLDVLADKHKQRTPFNYIHISRLSVEICKELEYLNTWKGVITVMYECKTILKLFLRWNWLLWDDNRVKINILRPTNQYVTTRFLILGSKFGFCWLSMLLLMFNQNVHMMSTDQIPYSSTKLGDIVEASLESITCYLLWAGINYIFNLVSIFRTHI